MTDTNSDTPSGFIHDRRKVDRSINELEARMVARDMVVDGMKVKLDENVKDVKAMKTSLVENNHNTKEVLEILHAGKGFFKVVGWIGNVVKYCALVGAPLVAFWYTLKHGGKP